MTTDFLIREPEKTYRAKARDLLTSHALADFRKCPQLYHRKKLGLIPDEDRPAYLVGRAAHTLILEGQEAFDRGYAVGGPINPNTGRPFGPAAAAYGEWAAEQAAQGRECVTEEQNALAAQMAQAVKAHPIARELLAEGIPEGVVRTEYGGMAGQGRIDWFNPRRGLVDLKTTDVLDFFVPDARRFNYANQVSFYASLLGIRAGCRPSEIPVFFIAVEKKQPFRCGVWKVAEAVLASARQENEAAMERLKRCEESGIWPTLFEEVLIFDG